MYIIYISPAGPYILTTYNYKTAHKGVKDT